MSSVSWYKSKVGYDPGQTQELEVYFEARSTSVVKVSFWYYAKSLGADSFSYGERHNRATIWVGNNSYSFTYQLHGNRASTSRSGSFYVYNVGNGVTSLPVYYENDRIWVNAPSCSWSPRSTGVYSQHRIGSLSIPDNVKYTITYHSGYSGGSINNIPGSTKLYAGTKYRISNNILTDNANHYVFTNGYTLSSSGAVNTAKPRYSLNSQQTLSGNTNLYACWKPQTYYYNFYKELGSSIQFPELTTTYTYTYPATILPNLNTLTNNNSTVNNYYKVGYNFNGWTSTKGDVNLPELACTIDSNTNFYAKWSPIKSKIVFNYGFNNYKREIPYTYDENFDFTYALKNEAGEFKKATLIRPGYRLIGWVYDKAISDKVYLPFQAPKVNYTPDGKVPVSLGINKTITNREFADLGLNLYAVWEYYTTVYLFTDGVWKLSLPYEYTEDGWKICLTYGYVKNPGEQNPSWKL